MEGTYTSCQKPRSGGVVDVGAQGCRLMGANGFSIRGRSIPWAPAVDLNDEGTSNTMGDCALCNGITCWVRRGGHIDHSPCAR